MEHLITSWRGAKSINVIRQSPCGLYPLAILDKGVNYFVLALEKLGCSTHYSCEGHFDTNNYVPEMYIVFTANESCYNTIKNMTFNIAELYKEINKKDYYSIRIWFDNPQDKTKKLSKLAREWNKILGPIRVIEQP